MTIGTKLVAPWWNDAQRFVDADGKLTTLARRVLNQILSAIDLSLDTQYAPDFQARVMQRWKVKFPIVVTPSASPFTYSVPRRGQLMISGTTTSVALTRVGIANSFASFQGVLDVLPGDSIVVTYTSAPTMNYYVT